MDGLTSPTVVGAWGAGGCLPSPTAAGDWREVRPGAPVGGSHEPRPPLPACLHPRLVVVGWRLCFPGFTGDPLAVPVADLRNPLFPARRAY